MIGRALVAALLAAAPAAAAEDGLAALAPHEARYDLTIDRSRPSGGVEDAYGELAVTREVSCASVRETASLVVTFAARGRQTRVEQISASVEDRDGAAFRVSVRERTDAGPWRERVLRAEREAGGYALTEGARAGGRLPAETLFPGAFLARALAAAGAREPRFEALLFDGAAADALTVSVDIGDARAYAGRHEGDPLRAPEAWPLRSAYYARERSGARPLLMVETVVDADGVLRSAHLPLSPAPVVARLTSLRFGAAPAC